MTDGFRKDRGDNYSWVRTRTVSQFKYTDIREANEILNAGNVEANQLNEMFDYFRDVLYESRKQRRIIDGLVELVRCLADLTGRKY